MTCSLPQTLHCLSALIARAKLAEPFPRVDPVVVTIAEHELNTVSADVIGAEHCKIVGDGSRIEDTKPGYFAHAVGAQALGPQVLDRVDAHVSIVPSDGDLVRPGFLYLKRVWHME